MCLFPLALFDVFELLLYSFEPFGGRYPRDDIFGASLGLLGIGIFLFESSNTSELGVEGIKPQIMCYVIGVEVMHMLGDGACGRAPCEL